MTEKKSGSHAQKLFVIQAFSSDEYQQYKNWGDKRSLRNFITLYEGLRPGTNNGVSLLR